MGLEQFSKDSMRHYYRGRVFESTGELDIAIDEYTKSLELGADYADIRNSLGRAYAKKGMFEEAEREFRIALEMNPHYLEAQQNLNELQIRLSIRGHEQDKKTGKTHDIRESESRQYPGRREKEPVKFKFNKFILIYILALVFLVINAVFLLQFLPKKSDMVFPIPSDSITGIYTDKKNVWFSDLLKQEIYQCELYKSELLIKKKYTLSSVYPANLCVIDKYLWTCDSWSRKVNKHILDDKLTVIQGADSPGSNPATICFDGKNIWTTDAINRKIYKHKTGDTLSIESMYSAPGEQIILFTYDGKNYWSADAKTQMLYKHDRNIDILSVYTLNTSGKKISTIYLDSKYIWCVYEGEQQLYRYPRSKLIK